MGKPSLLAGARRLVGRQLAQRGALAAGMMLVGLLSVAISFADHVRGAEPALLAEMVLAGAMVAWIAAWSPVPEPWAAVLLPGAGLVRAFWRIGRIGPSVGKVVGAALRLSWDHGRPAWSTAVSLRVLQDGLLEIGSEQAALAIRIWDWLRSLLVAKAAFDPVASALLWGLVSWFLGSWAGWMLRRRSQPMAALLPALAVLAYATYYSGSGAGALLLPLAAVLGLTFTYHHQLLQKKWQAENLIEAAGLTARLNLVAVPVCLGLITAAALAPSLSFDHAVRFAQRLSGRRQAQENPLGTSLGFDRIVPYDSPLYPSRTTGLPNRHLIGAGDELSEQVVLITSVINLPIEGPPPQFYWRALAYDRYLGHGWATSPTLSWTYLPGEATDLAPAPDQRLIRQKVRQFGQSPNLVYSAGSLVAADQAYEVAWRIAGRDAFAATLESDSYEVASLVSEATEEELRTAAGEVPDWISERYLALPDDVPVRVASLARDLTATAPTPYDRALAIRDYLRQIPYDLDVALPPEDRDLVDWFLFDSQAGYCDYYASAMVVLARSAGLPARLVVGYYTGLPQQTEGTYQYTVTAADGHSWVEVYLAGFGWIEFDPTAGRPTIERTGGGTPPPPPSLPVDFDRRSPWLNVRPLLDWGRRRAGTGLVGLAAVLGLVPAIDLGRLQRLETRHAVSRVYQRVVWLAGRLGLNGDPSLTPFEFSRAYDEWIAHRPGSRLIGLLLPGPEEIWQLAHRNVRAVYSRQSIEAGETFRVWRSWWWLAPRLALAALLAGWG